MNRKIVRKKNWIFFEHIIDLSIRLSVIPSVDMGNNQLKYSTSVLQHKINVV